MEAILLHFESLVPAPKQVAMLNFVFRYTEKTVQQAIVQKLVRVITMDEISNYKNYGLNEFIKERFYICRTAIARMGEAQSFALKPGDTLW